MTDLSETTFTCLVLFFSVAILKGNWNSTFHLFTQVDHFIQFILFHLYSFWNWTLTSSPAGSSPSVSTKKPRSRGLFSSLFCCLCRDRPEPPPVNNNAPLLVEENGTVSKVFTVVSPLACLSYFHNSAKIKSLFCGYFRSKWSRCCLQSSQKTLGRSVWL